MSGLIKKHIREIKSFSFFWHRATVAITKNFSSPRAPLCMIFAALKSSTAEHDFTGVHATMMKQHFDAPTELAELRHHCQARRKSHYRRSRLNKCRAELVALTKAGASLRQLAIWLQRNKHIKVSHTSIMRYLKKLPEMNQENHLENK